MTERLAAWSSRRPWRTIGAWGALLAVSIGVIGAFLGDALSGDEEVTRRTESRRAYELQAQRLSSGREPEASEIVVIRSDASSVGDARFRQHVADTKRQLEAAGARVATFYDTRNERLVSADGDATALLVDISRYGEDRIERLVEIVERAGQLSSFDAAITGEFTLDADFSALAEEDLRNGELMFGMPAALVVLLLVFGSVVAGLLPLLLAIVSIVVAMALLALVGQPFPLSVFATNMLTAIGLALGIDYSLFVLSRYREERLRRRSELDAVKKAGATASRAVLFSGIAFTLAMIGLLLVPSTIMRSLAIGAILAGLASLAAALTLLPALLGLLGDRVNALRIPLFGRSAVREESPFWSGVVRAVTRRPTISLLAVTVALLALALPVLQLNSGEAGVSTLPDRVTAKQGFVALTEEFPGETTDPVEVVIDGEASSAPVRAGIERLEAKLRNEPRFGEPQEERSAAGDLTVLRMPVRGDPRADEAIDAVGRLRGQLIPASFRDGVEVLVTGETAEAIDNADTMDDWLPVVVAFVLGLSLMLLTLAFRSIVVAAKAIAVNLLSVGAAYGLLVLVFQEGVGNELFGFRQVDTVESWVPLFLFAVLFGLSMDYHVFLLSRIRERFAATGDNSDAVAHGVSSTGRIITGAALIIVAVFSGFARGDLVMFQQMGFGCAVALLLDATIVRLVLVPAAMQLLGSRNWYLPTWLRWLPDVHVEGARPRSAEAPAVRS
jgi:putative drug exporter of the RND superfamily